MIPSAQKQNQTVNFGRRNKVCEIIEGFSSPQLQQFDLFTEASNMKCFNIKDILGEK